jgi:hypothetical protein
MSHTPFRSLFLGAVLFGLSAAGTASAQQNSARPVASPAAGRAPTRGHHRRRTDSPHRPKADSATARPAAAAPSPLPKLVGKKPVNDDPLAGLQKL